MTSPLPFLSNFDHVDSIVTMVCFYIAPKLKTIWHTTSEHLTKWACRKREKHSCRGEIESRSLLQDHPRSFSFFIQESGSSRRQSNWKPRGSNSSSTTHKSSEYTPLALLYIQNRRCRRPRQKKKEKKVERDPRRDATQELRGWAYKNRETRSREGAKHA